MGKDGILAKCKELAHEWALDFLDSTNETGELQRYYEKGNISTIQENFYMWYISGHTRDYNLLYEDDLKTLADDERVELADEVIEYNEAVESLLPTYIKK